MLYVLAAWTGYRRSELASLTLRSFNFDTDPPTVSVKASYSKRRRNDVVPLHPAVVQRLIAWLDGKSQDLATDAPVFALKTKTGGLRRTSKMMKLDLERAGIPYCDEDGLYADFHANRHTFISNLAKAGVSPKIAQSIARHSDVNLTLNVYSHVGISEQAAAIRSLAGPPVQEAPNPNAIHHADFQKFAHGFAQTPTQHGFRCHQLAITPPPRAVAARAATRCRRSS
jgi:integrase